jgi:hypothetical protein
LCDSDDGAITDLSGSGWPDSTFTPPVATRRPEHYNPAQWPENVTRIRTNTNFASVRFIDIDVGTCTCFVYCDKDTCLNAASGVYCSTSNCKVGKQCGNRLKECDSLSIVTCSKGYGVVASRSIPSGTIIGEYTGVVVLGSDLTDAQIEKGYLLQFQSHSTRGEKVYIDASICGGICRLVNHSCSPNCRFEERSHRTRRKMVIITHEHINAGDEVTVKYTEDIRFVCLCMSDNCVSLIRPPI